jgi:hypothetical protein
MNNPPGGIRLRGTKEGSMRRVIACVVLFALVAALPVPARAGTSTDVALGLASFAVFNQVVGPLLRGGGHGRAWGHRREVVVHRTVVTQPAVVYAAPVVVSAPVVASPVVAAAAAPTVVHYPHGRYELTWNGAQYVWVWHPTVPPPPPPPPAPATPAPAP